MLVNEKALCLSNTDNLIYNKKNSNVSLTNNKINVNAHKLVSNNNKNVSSVLNNTNNNIILNNFNNKSKVNNINQNNSATSPNFKSSNKQKNITKNSIKTNYNQYISKTKQEMKKHNSNNETSVDKKNDSSLETVHYSKATNKCKVNKNIYNNDNNYKILKKEEDYNYPLSINKSNIINNSFKNKLIIRNNDVLKINKNNILTNTSSFIDNSTKLNEQISNKNNDNNFIKIKSPSNNNNNIINLVNKQNITRKIKSSNNVNNTRIKKIYTNNNQDKGKTNNNSSTIKIRKIEKCVKTATKIINKQSYFLKSKDKLLNLDKKFITKIISYLSNKEYYSLVCSNKAVKKIVIDNCLLIANKYIISSFNSVYNKYLSLIGCKLMLSYYLKEKDNSCLNVSVVIYFKANSELLFNTTVAIAYSSKYDCDKDLHKNNIRFDVLNKGPLTYWCMREYTSVRSYNNIFIFIFII